MILCCGSPKLVYRGEYVAFLMNDDVTQLVSKHVFIIEELGSCAKAFGNWTRGKNFRLKKPRGGGGSPTLASLRVNKKKSFE